MKRFLLLIILLILNGCADMNINKFVDQKPKFILENYFDGKVEAWGMFHDRFGNLKRQFKVNIKGSVQDNKIILDERFIYDDGEKEQRIWHIDILPENRYEGKADDVIGIAEGVSAGNALNWKYHLLLKVNKNQIKVEFDDWMFLQERGILMNRAEVKKYGINLGVVSITFLKIK